MSDETIVKLADGFEVANQAQWRARVDTALKGGDFTRRMVSKTADGLAIEPLYTATTEPWHAATLGPRPDGTWDIRQRLANPDADASNVDALADLAGGVSSLTLQLAAPGQFGLSARAESLKRVLDGVILEAVPIALDAGGSVFNASGALMALWQGRGLARENWTGAFNADPLGLLARTGSLYYELPRALVLAGQLAVDTQGSPGLTALLADGRSIHAAGGSEAQEVAFVLASLVSYLRVCEGLGLPPDTSLSKIAVALACDADQLMTIAKLRAARVCLDRIGEACGVWGLGARIHITAETASRMLTRRDARTNILRLSIATASAAFGGANAITCGAFTDALGLPAPAARRIARNIQIVLMEESGLGRVSDPAAGAYAIEALTGELAQKAWELFQVLEQARAGDLSGLPAALINGSFQADVSKVAAVRARAIATGEIDVVGVSAFPSLGDESHAFKPFPKPAPAELPGCKATPLEAKRLAAPFEALRDRVEDCAARTRPPTAFLAILGDAAKLQPQVAYATNLLASAGLEAIGERGFAQAADVVAAFSASDARCAVIVGSALPDATAMQVAASLKSADALVVLMAGRPDAGEAQVLNAAGVDVFIYRGIDRIDVLERVLASLKV